MRKETVVWKIGQPETHKTDGHELRGRETNAAVTSPHVLEGGVLAKDLG